MLTDNSEPPSSLSHDLVIPFGKHTKEGRHTKKFHDKHLLQYI